MPNYTKFTNAQSLKDIRSRLFNITNFKEFEDCRQESYEWEDILVFYNSHWHFRPQGFLLQLSDLSTCDFSG